MYPDHELIIGGDFNGIGEGDPTEEGSISWFTAEFGVVDVHADFHTGPFPSIMTGELKELTRYTSPTVCP
jgi:hypothetical protein